jgi:geranylgeranyl diphosphate synthase type I
MPLTVSTLDAFESYLVSALNAIPADANRLPIRDHFALDDLAAQRGKRMRPRILLTVTLAEGGNAEDGFAAAAALEILHNFSLVHDDIEDGDEVRHGRPTTWATFGIEHALIAGDAMSALSYLTLLEGSAHLSAPRALALARCLQRAHYHMCEGQAFDIGFETASHVDFDAYLKMIDGKTAALLAASCELGALAAGCDADRASAYAQVGRVYGLAFQVRDDILGTWGRTEQTGKPSGADIRKRKWSFPVTWALSGPPSVDRSIVADAYATIGTLEPEVADRVIAALERLGAREAADAACTAYIAEANAIANTHGLDRDGALAAFLSSTGQRSV